MINEYVLNKGVRDKLSLEALSHKYDSVRKQDVLKNMLSKGLNYSDLPKNLQISYLRDDILATADIFQKQERLFRWDVVWDLVWDGIDLRRIHTFTNKQWTLGNAEKTRVD